MEAAEHGVAAIWPRLAINETHCSPGRCGEALADRAVMVRLQHALVPGYSRDFRLQSGRV